MGVTCRRLGTTHKFFPEKCPLDISLRQLTQFRESQYLKSLKIDFFTNWWVGLVVIWFRSSEIRNALPGSIRMGRLF